MQTLSTVFWSSEEYASDCGNDLERLGAGKKGERSINETQFPSESFLQKNRTTFSEIFFPEIFALERTKKLPFTNRNFVEFFVIGKQQLIGVLHMMD